MLNHFFNLNSDSEVKSITQTLREFFSSVHYAIYSNNNENNHKFSILKGRPKFIGEGQLYKDKFKKFCKNLSDIYKNRRRELNRNLILYQEK